MHWSHKFCSLFWLSLIRIARGFFLPFSSCFCLYFSCLFNPFPTDCFSSSGSFQALGCWWFSLLLVLLSLRVPRLPLTLCWPPSGASLLNPFVGTCFLVRILTNVEASTQLLPTLSLLPSLSSAQGGHGLDAWLTWQCFPESRRQHYGSMERVQEAQSWRPIPGSAL